MTYSFNLIDQPWIPCTTNDGHFAEVSLYGLLAEAHTLREICCETPLMTAAIFPMVLALLHRVFGPEDTDAWERLWRQGHFPMGPIENYFHTWYERFDLFHPEYPFYQAKDDRVEPKSLIHLIHSIGNTGTLFTHANEDTRPELSPAEAARYLLTGQVFRTAGLSGLDEKFTDSPHTRGVIFWAGGAHLFEVLMLNLIAYPKSSTMTHTRDDAPVWEQDMPLKARTYPYGYLDYLTWPGNRIWLIPETVDDRIVVNTMTVAPGLHIAADVLSPQKRYTAREDNEGIRKWSFMYFNAQKALWRDYHSLIALDSNSVRPPAIVQWLAELTYDVFDEDEAFQLTATGMLANQAKPVFYRQDHLPLPTALLRDPTNALLITQAIQWADDVAKQVNNSAKALAEEVLKRGGDSKPDLKDRRDLINHWGVSALYWAQLEPSFWEFIESLAGDQPDPLVRWEEVLRANARTALDAASRMSGKGAAALHGQVIAQRILNAGLKKVFKPEE